MFARDQQINALEFIINMLEVSNQKNRFILFKKYLPRKRARKPPIEANSRSVVDENSSISA